MTSPTSYTLVYAVVAIVIVVAIGVVAYYYSKKRPKGSTQPKQSA